MFISMNMKLMRLIDNVAGRCTRIVVAFEILMHYGSDFAWLREFFFRFRGTASIKSRGLHSACEAENYFIVFVFLSSDFVRYHFDSIFEVIIISSSWPGYYYFCVRIASNWMMTFHIPVDDRFQLNSCRAFTEHYIFINENNQRRKCVGDGRWVH